MPPAAKDEPDGDIFAEEGAAEPKKKKSTKKKTKGRTDDELFGNTDDIFGDIPASTGKSPKTKKKKKKTAAASSGEGGGAVGGASEAPDGKCFMAITIISYPKKKKQKQKKKTCLRAHRVCRGVSCLLYNTPPDPFTRLWHFSVRISLGTDISAWEWAWGQGHMPVHSEILVLLHLRVLYTELSIKMSSLNYNASLFIILQICLPQMRPPPLNQRNRKQVPRRNQKRHHQNQKTIPCLMPVPRAYLTDTSQSMHELLLR